LKLAITAGIGSNHVDLNAAIRRGITVAEVTFSNSTSVAEHAVMMMLSLFRDYIPAPGWAPNGGWNIADCVKRSYDVEGMQIGIVAGGRIGQAVARRMKGFDVGLHYYGHHPLPTALEEELSLSFHASIECMVTACDAITIHCPLTPETRHMFNDALLGKMRRGSYLVNWARGEICDENAIVRAMESGRLAGYAGDVWFPQPAPSDHRGERWRSVEADSRDCEIDHISNHGSISRPARSAIGGEYRYLATFGYLVRPRQQRPF
jgi:formate dehydrogenase